MIVVVVDIIINSNSIVVIFVKISALKIQTSASIGTNKDEK